MQGGTQATVTHGYRGVVGGGHWLQGTTGGRDGGFGTGSGYPGFGFTIDETIPGVAVDDGPDTEPEQAEKLSATTITAAIFFMMEIPT